MDYKETLIALLIENREYLCWQLSLDKGLLSDEQFDSIFDEYWKPKSFSDHEMIEMWRILKKINNEEADSLVDTLFRVDYKKVLELKKKL